MAQIYFGANSLDVAVGETFEVGVFLDTHTKSVAAVESQLQISPGLELVEILDGNSVLNLWVERPYGTPTGLNFSGLIPGGFEGQRGNLFVMALRAREAGEMKIAAQGSRILLNDGLGTATEAIPAPITLSVKEGDAIGGYVAPLDTQPPNEFTPYVVEQEDLGGWVVIFSAQDKGSGIDYYEIKEGLSGWKRVDSPYLLKKQNPNTAISLKAVDKASNERLVKVDSGDAFMLYGGVIFWSILILVSVSLGVYGFRLWKR